MADKPVVAMGADHGGFILKEALKQHLSAKGYEVIDFGTDTAEACDYPLFGHKAAKAVADGKAEFGIVICKTGFGMAIVANKVSGVRSAVCDTADEAESARRHNACNVLSLAATRVGIGAAKDIADVFLSTGTEGGRHERRVGQIKELER
ncbi:MAG: ribose 5-phosphate isomerase B [Candidatus Omnitrophota bacterium]